MKDFEKIDEFFNDKLSDYEESVPPYVWDNITEKLGSRKRRKRLIYIQSIAASVALLIAFFAGHFYTNTSNTEFDQFSVDKTVHENIIDSDNSLQESSAKLPDESFASNEKEGTTKANEEIINNDIKEEKINIKGFKNSIKPSDEYTLMATNEDVYNGDTNEKQNEKNFIQRLFNIDFTEFEQIETDPASIKYPETIQMAYVDIYQYEDNIKPGKKVENRWAVGGKASPVYSYRNVSSASNERENSYNDIRAVNSNQPSNESGIVSYSGGINIGYKISKRLDVYSGVFYSEIGQVSNDVYISEGQNTPSEPVYIATSMGNINTQHSSYNLVNSITDDYSVPPTDFMYDNESFYSSNSINSKIYQNIEFIEIPVMLKYKVLNKRFGINLLGGISTSFIVGNSSKLEYENNKYDIGETEDIQPVNYNSTVGLGFEYALSKRISVNLEPTFKYALNSISTTNKVYPYTLAVYTGINYKF